MSSTPESAAARPPVPQTRDLPYAAFISYAHSDNKEAGRKWGEWLQEMIRDFRVPASQVGKVTPVGEVPGRIRPVFLDRLELTAGGSLDPRLHEALEGSRFFFVLCSPNSVRSDWVGQEIQTFKELHGWQNIIPVVIAGEVTTKDAPANAIRPELWELMPLEGEPDGNEGGAPAQADRLPLYIDFRVRTAETGRNGGFEDGWTGVKFYDDLLKKEGKISTPYRRKLVAEYAREHKTHRYKLLAALLGLKPRELEEDTNAAEISRQRKMIVQALVFAGISLGLAVTAFVFYRRANLARAEAERSLLMIGDAHESASRLLSDVLVDLRAKLEPGGQQGALDGARRIVDDYFKENELMGSDDDSRHMRSVVLNSRGYLELRMGDFAAAEKFYREALEIREDLHRRASAKPMHQHNLAVSFDNLGDLHATKAQAERKQGREGREEYVEALKHYRKSLALVQALAARPDATPQWRHDLAVSYFKVGDALFEGGDKDAALTELAAGFPIAESVAASDPDYAKWQAHLGLYCLEIGRLRALSGQDVEARTLLLRGKDIFEKLDGQHRLSSQYAEWLNRIKALLLDLAE